MVGLMKFLVVATVTVFGDGEYVQVSIVEHGDRPQLELDSHQVAECRLSFVFVC